MEKQIKNVWKHKKCVNVGRMIEPVMACDFWLVGKKCWQTDQEIRNDFERREEWLL